MSQFDATSATVTATVSGTATVATVALPTFSFPFPVEILGVSLNAGTGPTGAALIGQVLVGGSNAYSNTARPQIAAGATAGSANVPDQVYKVPTNTPISFAVAQIGSGTAGSNLTATIAYRKA